MKPRWDVLHGNDLVFTTHSTKAAPGQTRSGEGRHSPLTINSSLYSITSSKTEACFVGGGNTRPGDCPCVLVTASWSCAHPCARPNWMMWLSLVTLQQSALTASFQGIRLTPLPFITSCPAAFCRNTTSASIISVCAPGIAGVSIGFTILQWARAGSQAAMLLQIREDKAGLCFPSSLGNVEQSNHAHHSQQQGCQHSRGNLGGSAYGSSPPGSQAEQGIVLSFRTVHRCTHGFSNGVNHPFHLALLRPELFSPLASPPSTWGEPGTWVMIWQS